MNSSASKIDTGKSIIFGVELATKQFYFYANSAIILLGFLVIYYLIKKNNKNIRDEDSYDWSKYTIVSDKKTNNKRTDLKDKVKQRQKSLSKGNGLIKEEHRFPVINTGFEAVKKDNFLNLEEANNLQDMINYAASINQKENTNEPTTIENEHNRKENLESEITNTGNGSDKLDIQFREILRSSELDKDARIKKVLEVFKQLIRLKNKKLSEATYSALVELFIVNGYFDHASYFLCQMDRHKINIPRNLLDLFLEYSIQNKIFEKAEKNRTYYKNDYQDDHNNQNQNRKQEANAFYNKYDQYDPQSDADYAYYFSKKNLSKQRKDINNLFSSLKIDSKPFFPKSLEVKSSLGDIDPKNIKEFIPKGYKIEKKEEAKQN